jgi:hypothetical protein
MTPSNLWNRQCYLVYGAKLILSRNSTWIVLAWGFMACGGGSAFVSNATGGKPNSSVGGNFASGGTDGNDAAVGTGGIFASGGNAGSAGSPAAGGDTNAAGSTGYESVTCPVLQTDYAAELAIAKSCSAGTDNCDQTVLDALDCGCTVFVSSARTGALTSLEQIRTAWKNKSCSTGIACGVVCTVPTSASCVGVTTSSTSGTCTASTS